MSREAVTGFLQKLLKYDALQAELQAAAAGKAKKAPTFITVAAKHGFDFTVGELEETLNAIHQHRLGEISEDELRAITGDLIEFPKGADDCFDLSRNS